MNSALNNSSLMKQSQNNSFTSALNEVDVKLKWLKKKKDLLLKRCHLVSVQRKVQTLWCQDVENMFVNDFEEENNDNVLILKQTSSVVSNEWSAEKNLSVMMIKWSIYFKYLNTYTEKFIQKHLNFICSTEMMFCLMFENFFNNETKILYVMQFLMRES